MSDIFGHNVSVAVIGYLPPGVNFADISTDVPSKSERARSRRISKGSLAHLEGVLGAAPVGSQRYSERHKLCLSFNRSSSRTMKSSSLVGTTGADKKLASPVPKVTSVGERVLFSNRQGAYNVPAILTSPYNLRG